VARKAAPARKAPAKRTTSSKGARARTVQVRRHVEALLVDLAGGGELSKRDAALGEVALKLAAQLDRGAGLATAAVAKELRQVIEVLTGGPDEDVPDFLQGAADPVK
jgi:hypothetical protein